MKTKERKPTMEVPPISEWSVTKYGVTLFVNTEPFNLKGGESLDVEDDEEGNFVGIGIYCPTSNCCFYWSDWEKAKKLTIKPFIAHNGRTDLAKLKAWGFKVDHSYLMWDTQLMSHIIDSSRKMYGLKNLSKVDLGIEYPSYQDITGKKTSAKHVTLDKLPLDLVSNYNACDCYVTYKLYEKQKEQTRKLNFDNQSDVDYRYFNQLEKPIAFLFQEMEQQGIRIDVPYLTKLEQDLSSKRQVISKEIENELGPINLNSPKQLLEALNAKGISPEFKGKPSTDKRALERFRNTYVVDKLLQFSELETLLSTFITPYLARKEEGQAELIVHPNFNQCGTRTGRPSCSNPNLLQIPKRTENGKLVRRMFIARENNLFGDADFGQIEPRILAHLSQDKAMCKMFNDGTDFHSFTSNALAIDRDRAKILNLSVGYRATYRSVSSQLKCSYDAAQNEIDKWWSMFPQLYDYQQGVIHKAKADGYITTLLGRRIKVNDLDAPNVYRREAAERQAINNLTQGSAAEVMKLAMIKAHKAGINVLVQVYDELLIEHPESEIEGAMLTLKECMETAYKLEVPLVVDGGIGANWEACH